MRIRTVSIPDPGSSKNLSILTPKKAKKWFLSSKKYDPGCSSRIPDPDADFLPSRTRIPDPGVKKAPNPGSRIRIRNTGQRQNTDPRIRTQVSRIHNTAKKQPACTTGTYLLTLRKFFKINSVYRYRIYLF
jgi:hypothetical protein